MKLTNKYSILALALVLSFTFLFANHLQAQTNVNDNLDQQPAQNESQDVVQDETVTAADLNVSRPATGLWGWLKNIGQSIQYTLTFNPVAKAELKLKHANEALIAAQQAIQNKPDSYQASEQYSNYMKKYETLTVQLQQQVQTLKDKAQTNPEIDLFLNRLTDNSFKQQRVMDHLSQYLNNDQQAKLRERKDEMVKTVAEALKNLDDQNALPQRLENILSAQSGSRLIHLKNIEALNLLKSQLPANYQQIINKVEENTVSRLNQAIQNIEPQARIDRIKSYLNSSHNDPLSQINTIQALENNPTTIQEIKDNLSAITSEKAQKIDQILSSLKSDENRAVYLEKVKQSNDLQTQPLLQAIQDKFNQPQAPVVPENPPVQQPAEKTLTAEQIQAIKNRLRQLDPNSTEYQQLIEKLKNANIQIPSAATSQPAEPSQTDNQINYQRLKTPLPADQK